MLLLLLLLMLLSAAALVRRQWVLWKAEQHYKLLALRLTATSVTPGLVPTD
jgi:hypothetical protein